MTSKKESKVAFFFFFFFFKAAPRRYIGNAWTTFVVMRETHFQHLSEVLANCDNSATEQNNTWDSEMLCKVLPPYCEGGVSEQHVG